MKLRKRIKQDWIAALESGEYTQGTERLKTGDEFCCLGVLCDLAVRAGEGRWDENSDYVAPDGAKEAGSLPEHVVRWAFKGADEEINHNSTWDDPVVTKKNGDQANLTHLNDEDRKSFKYLAKAIDRSL